jgi:hypothetical protein
LRDVMTSERAIQIEHVTIRSNKPFVTVKANLEQLVPKLTKGFSNSFPTARLSSSNKSLNRDQNLRSFCSAITEGY